LEINNAIVNSFNNYFVSIADRITENTADQDSITNSINLMKKSATNRCPTINWSYTTTAEVKRIIKSQKRKTQVDMKTFQLKYSK
jgi:hypothetical protein